VHERCSSPSHLQVKSLIQAKVSLVTRNNGCVQRWPVPRCEGTVRATGEALVRCGWGGIPVWVVVGASVLVASGWPMNAPNVIPSAVEFRAMVMEGNG
jgi:hypothetical protein